MSKFKPTPSPLAGHSAAEINELARRLTPSAFQAGQPAQPGNLETESSILMRFAGPSKDQNVASAELPGQTAMMEVDSIEQLASLQVGHVAKIALHFIGDNKHNARVFYLSSDIDATTVSMQKNQQLAIATGWVENGKVFLNDGQKRARAARAGGLPYLKVEIIQKPDPRDGYLKSRAMNVERSDQTSLDDAIRWREMLDEGIFKDQGDLALAVGLEVPTVSKTLAINTIPSRLLLRMKESSVTSSRRVAYEISRIFVSQAFTDDRDKAEEIAADVIDEVVKKGLSSEATKSLIESRLSGPKRRARSEIREVRFGETKGQLKVAAGKGTLNLSFKGLSKEQLERLVDLVEHALEKPPGV